MICKYVFCVWILVAHCGTATMTQPKGCTESAVEKLYGEFPYPPRNPREEKNGLILFPKHEETNLLRSTIFGGSDLPLPFRAAIIGGGTGDATLALAIGLVRQGRGKNSTILHVDLSQASIDVAKARIRKHKDFLMSSGIQILFLKSKISQLPQRDLGGTFHYINCVGVLHHLPDPLSGLKILNDLLTMQGGINIMMYARIGRTGVYHVREMARLLSQVKPSHDIPTMKEAKSILRDSLLPTNWFMKNDIVRGSIDVRSFGDVGLSDLILNPCDIAMSITEVAQFAQNAGLRILTPVKPELYEPTGNKDLIAQLQTLSWLEKARFAELQKGNILTHHVWMVKQENNVIATENLPWNESSVPCCADWFPGDTGMQRKDVERGLVDGTVSYNTQIGGGENDNVVGDFTLPALGPSILLLFNCKRTLKEIYNMVKEQASWEFEWFTFLEHAEAWRKSLAKGRAIHTVYFLP